MIHLRLRSEYSFRRAFGRVADLIAAVGDAPALALTDNGTWGHVDFFHTVRKAGKKPILGVELLVVRDARKRERQNGTMMALLARNLEGLRELYHLVTLANDESCFYYVPRLDYNDINGLSDNLYVLTGAGPDVARLRRRPHVFLEVNPGAGAWNTTALKEKGWEVVVCADNVYATPDDRMAYEVLLQNLMRGQGGGIQRRTTPGHILSEPELRNIIPGVPDSAFLNTERIAADCELELPTARMVRWADPVPLLTLCEEGAVRRQCDLSRPGYRERLTHELDMIEGKNFADYFYVIADMVNEAKRTMLVGPARGSSAGSLVCYLLGITDIDPLQHGLMFERFIDITREDLPDIDIDFPDEQREEVWQNLVAKYGGERVGRLGTINRYKAKSALNDMASALGIPIYELKDFQGAIIERSSGDARAEMSIMDSFELLDAGKVLLRKYPELATAARLEGHARYHGTHAAGYIVAEEPIALYCSIDHTGSTQIDKKDAEKLNLLKIDALGLRTLTVLQEALDLIGKDREWLIGYPLDDEKAFALFNRERFAGIFQFEGYALQILTRQMGVREFNDIVALGALARPGPLHCGGAAEFVRRRTGAEPVEYLHALARPFTEDTFGCVIYQEQVMAVGREIGDLSWEDVNQIRRAMSKSMGEEFFGGYWEKFKAGAEAKGIPTANARAIWEKMVTFGSWAFNKSHAVSYGMISYWCAVLKAHWPLEFAAATLRHVRDEEQATRILRELSEDNIAYVPVDAERSGLTWEVVDGRLIGGLTNIKGIGLKKAKEIMRRRQSGIPLLPGMKKLLAAPITPYDDIFEGERLWGDIYRNPRKHRIIHVPHVSYIKDIHDPGLYVFIARLKEKNLRDLNEYASVVKRGGRMIETKNLFLNLLLEDDTGSILATIGRFEFEKLGRPIIDTGKIGDWYLWKGTLEGEWRKVKVTQVRRLSA